MKRIFKLTTFAAITSVFIGCSSDDKIIDQVFDDTTRGAILRTVTSAGSELDLQEPGSSFSVTVEVEDNKGGALLESVDVLLSFDDRTPDNGTNDVDEIAFANIPASAFTTGSFGLPVTTFTGSIDDFAPALGLSDTQYTGGDRVIVRFVLNLTDGRSFTNTDANGGILGGSFFRSPYRYVISLVGCPPRPGVYTIEMTDSYGDGWQTTTANSGPGLTVTVDGVQIAEVGLCSPYDNTQAGYCTVGLSSGSTTITIPDGANEAIWFFPGDFYGEIGLTIRGPQNQVVFSAAPGTLAAGELAVVLCR